MRVGRKPFVEEIKNEGKQQHDDQDRKNRPETQLLLMDRGAAFEFVFAPGFHDGLNSGVIPKTNESVISWSGRNARTLAFGVSSGSVKIGLAPPQRPTGLSPGDPALGAS
jgi:hypothetical protein